MTKSSAKSVKQKIEAFVRKEVARKKKIHFPLVLDLTHEPNGGLAVLVDHDSFLEGSTDSYVCEYAEEMIEEIESYLRRNGFRGQQSFRLMTTLSHRSLLFKFGLPPSENVNETSRTEAKPNEAHQEPSSETMFRWQNDLLKSEVKFLRHLLMTLMTVFEKQKAKGQ